MYCHFKQILANKHSKYQRSPSYTALNVNLDLPDSYKINQNSLTQLIKQKNVEDLAQLGGLKGIALALDTDLENGIHCDDEDIAYRHEAFGSNTHCKPPTKSLFHFVWEALKDPTILILLVCAVMSLGFGIKQHGPKEGWYDGGSIFIVVFLVITVSAGSNFKQNKQFDKLSEARDNGYAGMLVISVGINTWGNRIRLVTRKPNGLSVKRVRIIKITEFLDKIFPAVAFLIGIMLNR